jgi:DNA-binding NtrC family response regulator
MKNILIIEDFKNIRENTASVNELNNCGVIVAENARPGFQMVKKINRRLFSSIC